MKSFFYTLREILEIVIVAILVVVGVRSFLIQPFLVDGSSMEPNFQSGDYILINEVSLRFREPERGEVIVFHYPGNENTYFIKRIIGLPNERVSVKDSRVYISNNQDEKSFLVNEKYLPEQLKTAGNKEIILKSGEYFVMGDNREASFDSRQWGPLKKSEIVGMVWLRLWPLNKVMAFEKPSY
ncbi:MAG: signal peptidase I [Patescibacteria group bacterium]|nr:signal peptidase I [Patescibacteria group bacterium]